jgi:hypothetical protein
MKTGICLLIVFTVWIGSLQARTFKNKEGKELQASITGSSGSMVTLMPPQAKAASRHQIRQTPNGNTKRDDHRLRFEEFSD